MFGQRFCVFSMEEYLTEFFGLLRNLSYNSIELTLFLNFSLMNGLNIANSMLKMYELLKMWTAFNRNVSTSCNKTLIMNTSVSTSTVHPLLHTWTHSNSIAANDGVNCIIWLKDKPSKSNIINPPHICVVGSLIDDVIAIKTDRNRSSRLTFAGFHFSMAQKWEENYKSVTQRVIATKLDLKLFRLGRWRFHSLQTHRLSTWSLEVT